MLRRQATKTRVLYHPCREREFQKISFPRDKTWVPSWETNVMSCCTGDRHAPCVPLCHGCQGHGTTMEPNSLNQGGGRGSSRKRFLTVGHHRLTAEMMGFHSPWEALFSLLGKRGTGMHKLPREAAQPIISPLSMCCKVWAWWHMSQKIQFSQNASIQMASPLQCQSWWEANSI